MEIWLKLIWKSLGFPLLIVVIAYVATLLLATSLNPYAHVMGNLLLPIIVIIAASWFSFRVIDAVLAKFKGNGNKSAQIAMIILPVVKTMLKFVIAIILINILLPSFNLPEKYYTFADKSLDIILISLITWIILKTTSILENVITQHYIMLSDNKITPRIIYTKIRIIKRIADSIIILLAVAIALLTFDSVRRLGVSLLASAGFASVVLGIAAQKTLATFFSGLQIALTQPIKINDLVVVENEFGSVEEITLSYVVIKLWDQRRLIIPINYFIEKPFQNWTRTSTELLGTVYLYMDYNISINAIREEFKRLLAKSPFWDGKKSELEVTDCKEKTLELRVLVSAKDTGDLWNLRCTIRESLITYIQNNYPQSLPKLRIITES